MFPKKTPSTDKAIALPELSEAGAGSGGGTSIAQSSFITTTTQSGRHITQRPSFRDGRPLQHMPASEHSRRVSLRKPKKGRSTFIPTTTRGGLGETIFSGDEASPSIHSASMDDHSLDAIIRRLHESAIAANNTRLASLPDPTDDPLSPSILSPTIGNPKSVSKPRPPRLSHAGETKGSSRGNVRAVGDVESGNPIYGKTVLFGEKQDGTPIAIAGVQIDVKSQTMTGLKYIWGDNTRRNWALAHQFDEYCFQFGARQGHHSALASNLEANSIADTLNLRHIQDFPQLNSLPQAIQQIIQSNQVPDRPFIDLKYDSKLVERQYQKKSTKKSATSCTSAMKTALCGTRKRRLATGITASGALLAATGFLIWWFILRCTDSIVTQNGSLLATAFTVFNSQSSSPDLSDGTIHATKCQEDLNLRLSIDSLGIDQVATVPFEESYHFASTALSCQSTAQGRLSLEIDGFSQVHEIEIQGQEAISPFTITANSPSVLPFAGQAFALENLDLVRNESVISIDSPTLSLRFPISQPNIELDSSNLISQSETSGLSVNEIGSFIHISGEANTTIAQTNQHLKITIATDFALDAASPLATLRLEYNQCGFWVPLFADIPFMPRETPLTFDQSTCQPILFDADQRIEPMRCIASGLTLSTQDTYTVDQSLPPSGSAARAGATIFPIYAEGTHLNRTQVINLLNSQQMSVASQFLRFNENAGLNLGSVLISPGRNGTTPIRISLPIATIQNTPTAPILNLRATLIADSGSTVRPLSDFSYDGNHIETADIVVRAARPSSSFSELSDGSFLYSGAVTDNVLVAIRNAVIEVPQLESGLGFTLSPSIDITIRETSHHQTVTTTIESCGADHPIDAILPATHLSTETLALPFATNTTDISPTHSLDESQLIRSHFSTNGGICLTNPDPLSALISTFDSINADYQLVSVEPCTRLNPGEQTSGTLFVQMMYERTDNCTALSTTQQSVSVTIEAIDREAQLNHIVPISIPPDDEAHIVFPTGSFEEPNSGQGHTLRVTIDNLCGDIDARNDVRSDQLNFQYLGWSVMSNETGLITIETSGDEATLRNSIIAIEGIAPDLGPSNSFLSNVCKTLQMCVPSDPRVACITTQVFRSAGTRLRQLKQDSEAELESDF